MLERILTIIMTLSRMISMRTATSKSLSRCDITAKKAAAASWKSLAAEDLQSTSPTFPIGKCFWPLSVQEKRGIERLVADREMHRLATRLRSRDECEEVDSLTPPIG